MRRWLVALSLLLLLPMLGSAQSVNYYPVSSGVTVLFKAAPNTTTVGTSEELLYSIVLPANTLSAVGDMVRVVAHVTTAANTNSKTLRLRLTNCAGTTFQNSNVTTTSAALLTSDAPLIRTGATTAQAFAGWTCAGTNCSNGVHQALTGLTFTSPITLAVCGITPTAGGEMTLTAVHVSVIK